MSQAEKPERPKLDAKTLRDMMDHEVRRALEPPDLSHEDRRAIVCKRVAEMLAKAVINEATNPDSTRVPLGLFPPGPGTKGEE